MAPWRLLLAVTLAATLATVTASSVPAAAHDQPIQPGVRVETPDATCTLGFVLDGNDSKQGTTYVTTAGHCGEVGDPVSAPGAESFGEIVYDSDANPDVALIEVDNSSESDVHAHLRGHWNVPSGVVSDDETEQGDALVLSGHGLGFSLTEPTREQRRGVLWEDYDDYYEAQAPLVQGDSGGPIVHAPTGKALGLVSQFNLVSFPPTTDKGPMMDWILTILNDNGFPTDLRTA